MTKKLFNVRGACFQTNSSSDHCVFLSMTNNFDKIDIKNYPELIIKKTKEGKYVLRIPSTFFDEFNEDGHVENDINSKIRYCVGLVTWEDMDEYEYEKAITPIVDILKEYLNVDDVEFGWDRDYKIDLTRKDREDCHRFTPEINHNSIDSSYRSIFESKYTLADFIFNKNSYVILQWEGDGSNELHSQVKMGSILDYTSNPDATWEITLGGKCFKGSYPVYPTTDINVYDRDFSSYTLYDTFFETKESKNAIIDRHKYNDNYLYFQELTLSDGKLYAVYCKNSIWTEACSEFYQNKDSIKKYNKILNCIPNYLENDGIKLIHIPLTLNEFNVTI